jgi:23S rRNA (cytidine2498-2'-O)-methyltransferase
MHVYLPAEGLTELEASTSVYLAQELQRSGASGVASGPEQHYVSAAGPLPAHLAFCQQVLPDAVLIQGASIQAWADHLSQELLTKLTDAEAWHLHLWPAYAQAENQGAAGQQRCRLIQAALLEKLKKRRRARLKSQCPELTNDSALIQVMLTGPETGWISLAPAALRAEKVSLISSFLAGRVPVAVDKAAPSRAFAKVLEAEARLGQTICKGHRCVDLGAAPGSWSYVAMKRGAHIIALDRSELRVDLMRYRQLEFISADAFSYRPSEPPVDWLLCDIIADPERSIQLLIQWLHARLMRHFILTIKFKGSQDYGLLDALKNQAPALCQDFRLTRLNANKNEVCAYGTVF